MTENINQIKLFILLNGQHMIGKVIKEDDKEMTVYAPAVILTGDDKEQGKMSLAFSPFLPFSKEKEFTFKTSLILTTSIPADPLANEYNRLFGSGLDIITKPSLIV